jgi:SAM-dependent methyltransferase
MKIKNTISSIIKEENMSSSTSRIYRYRFLAKYLHSRRSRIVILPQIKKQIKETDRVIDIGAGTCYVCKELEIRGIDVTPIDIKNKSMVNEIRPIVYDGSNIPFPNNHFDVALILTVLHHTINQEEIIREAKRVAKRLIIMEDVYENRLERYLTYFFDCIGNFEFKGHPHSNRTDQGWLKLFDKLGLRVMSRTKTNSVFVFTHATYCLEEKSK